MLLTTVAVCRCWNLPSIATRHHFNLAVGLSPAVIVSISVSQRTSLSWILTYMSPTGSFFHLRCQLLLLWLPCVADADIIVLPRFFFLLSFVFFPCLISAVADWMSTILPHMVWPWCAFRMQVWNMLHAASWKYMTQKMTQKSPSAHHCTTLSGCIFATKAHIDNRKKLVKQQYLPHMS